MSLPQMPTSPLLPDMLNVVGEDHAESGERRRLEKLFVQDMTGSSSYWTEADFPDLHREIPGRKKKGGTGQAKDPGADLMEYRAVHGVAMLIGAFDRLCDKAGEVAGSGNPTEALAFSKVNLLKFNKVKKRIQSTWEPTNSTDVNAAVQKVYDDINKVLTTYVSVMEKAEQKNATAYLVKATQALAGSRGDIDALLPPLRDAVGAPDTDDPSALAHDMRMQRSTWMGLATYGTRQRGVWKIGDGHIDDLKNQQVRVDLSKANFVTRSEFNQAFNAWKAWKYQQLQLLKAQKQNLQQQGPPLPKV